MSDNTILPERHYLKMDISISELCVVRASPLVYRFIFRLNMLNISKLSIRILGRKWTMRDHTGNLYILEADHVFSQDPMLTPGAVFSYGGYHDFPSVPTSMEVRYFGVDQMLMPFISTPYVVPKSCLKLFGRGQ